MSESIRLLASDIDGTLVDGTGRVSERTRRALTRAADRGIRLAIASGRTRGTMENVLSQLPPVDYLIQSNGAAILEMKTGQVIWKCPFPQPLIGEILSLLEENGVAWHIFSRGRGYMDASHAPVYREIFGAAGSEAFSPVEDLASGLLSACPEIEKFGVITREPRRKERLVEALSAYPQLAISSARWFNIEVNARNATKGNALKALAAYLRIPMEQMVAFGDADNDVSMLKAAGYGVAMGNAPENVAGFARYRTATNEEDGVARFLEGLLGLPQV